MRILVLREGRSGLRQFILSGKSAYRLLIALVILTPILFYVGSHLLLETAYSHRVAKLRRDNVALQRLLEQFEGRIENLEQEVISLSAMDRNLREHADIPDIASDIRAVGIGGSMVEVRTDMDYLLPLKDISLARLTERLDALHREMNLEQLSYEDIRDSLKDDLGRMRTTPSIRPVTRGEYTSGFGLRRDPYSKRYDFHRGQDISLQVGTPVQATADGRIIAARWGGNLGLYVKIDHGNGFHTLYGHLRIIHVDEGQRVTRGARIGESGNTGRATAPHLHYEVRHYNQPQNPTTYF
ncbi:MAG: M23 family metallopeptidase [Candidatus Neomarinimicrobiota bacterium]